MKTFLIFAWLFLNAGIWGVIVASNKPPSMWLVFPIALTVVAGFLAGVLIVGWLKGWPHILQ